MARFVRSVEFPPTENRATMEIFDTPPRIFSREGKRTRPTGGDCKNIISTSPRGNVAIFSARLSRMFRDGSGAKFLGEEGGRSLAPKIGFTLSMAEEKIRERRAGNASSQPV